MEAFSPVTPLWDLSQPNSFSNLPDDDFLELLQKQFPNTNGSPFSNGAFSDGVNPQNITSFALPSLSPPSDDSSPSPPNLNDSGSRGQSEKAGGDHDEDHTMKRKASDDDFEEGPSSKNQHTSGTAGRKGSARRKSSGSGQDESRLMKRKEQNRAAQRAFRERKEKHVKDLEDKVAALQAQNDQAQSENENLRDLLSRLQNENVALKNSSFTFAVPKNAGSTSSEKTTPVTAAIRESPVNLFGTAPRSSIPAQSPSQPASHTSPIPSGDMDWNSLTTFDPSVLKLLDESPQQTATDGAMRMDFGFGENGPSMFQYTTLASNPFFMSYADTFDTSPTDSSGADPNAFNFDMQALSPWPAGQTDVNVNMEDGTSLDSLFGTQYLDSQPPVDFNALLRTPSSTLSPIVHASVHSTPTTGSSPASNYSLFNTPRDSSSSFSEEGQDDCPKTKEEIAKRIAKEGFSSFAPVDASTTLRKDKDGPFASMVLCKGTNFPKTAQSDQNIEVLSAWRSITSNPKFKDSDINELCAEFSSKARCDGTKVVLEPQGVHHILEKLGSKKH